MKNIILIIGLVILGSTQVNASSLEKADAVNKDNKERLALNSSENADKLGLSIEAYTRLGHVAGLTEEYYAIESLIDIASHPSSIQLSNSRERFEDPSEALVDEMSALMRKNYALAAEYVGVSIDDFYPLLVKYIKLNNRLDEKTSITPKTRTILPSFKLGNRSDEGSDEEEVVIEVVIVTEDSLQELQGGGSAGLWNRWHRNAYKRWGLGSGTTSAVFISSTFTFTRDYHYENGVTTPGQKSCFGMCELRPHP
jgi:hypothetical protein